jgi:hypothetical protein
MPASYDVFVAFAGPDRDLARTLVDKLQHRGLTVRWEGHLPPEAEFPTGLTDFVASVLVFVVVVSKNWPAQHYAAEELATAVELYRRDRIVITPVWTEKIETEDRPMGIRLLTGITLPEHSGCISCVAGLINESVLRRKLLETQSELAQCITASRPLEIRQVPRVDGPHVKPATVDGLGGLLDGRDRRSSTDEVTRRE